MDVSQATTNFPDMMSKRELREAENQSALGGLRNPRHAVKQSPSLRNTGARLRNAIEPLLEAQISPILQDITSGVSDDWVRQVRKAIGTTFGVECADSEGLQHDLWQALLHEAADPDAECLSEWIQNGFPLGIKSAIRNTGIFPSTASSSAAIELSRLEGHLADDVDGAATNYKSFQEEVVHAQALLDQLVAAGRVEVYDSWQQVVDQFGPGAKLTRMACMVKRRDSGELKYRIVVDSRRSGINGLMEVRERVILPKITDVVAIIHHLQSSNSSWDAPLELYSIDFKDAFHMLPLRPEERQFVICKDGYGRYHVSKVVLFGLAPGPLLWARLASAAMRLAQSAVWDHEASVATYVDDPLMVIAGPDQRSRCKIFLVYVALWLALGLQISWKKASRGTTLQWIGFQLQLHGLGNGDLTVTLTESKRQKLLDAFHQIEQCKGMIHSKLLQYVVGVLGWVSSVIPIARPWLAMLWAALTQKSEPTRLSTRQRKGLIFVKQVEHALKWLSTLVREIDFQSPGLQRCFKWRPHAATVLIQTDACPFGMGGFLMIGNEFKAYWHDQVTEEDCQLFGAQPGDPSFQSEWELLAVWISIECFASFLRQDKLGTRVLLRTDNMATVRAAMEQRAKSPLMAQLAAEISLQCAVLQLLPICAQHVPGVLNGVADDLSRMLSDKSVSLPWQLRSSQKILPPTRSKDAFRAWPADK